MAYYEGGTLKEKIARGPLAIDEALDIAIQIGQGLAEAHTAGVVHRDIKPANLMLTKGAQVKIVDFGLAKLAGQVGLTQTGKTLGTVAYMSPEQARGHEVDHGADLWSLGVVLYEMLAGRRPFPGEHAQSVVYAILNTEVPPLPSARAEVPADLARAVGRALAKPVEGTLPDGGRPACGAPDDQADAGRCCDRDHGRDSNREGGAVDCGAALLEHESRPGAGVLL